MARAVDFYFDVGSPAAYLAWTQLPGLAGETAAAVNYRPILLGGVFQDRLDFVEQALLEPIA